MVNEQKKMMILNKIMKHRETFYKESLALNKEEYDSTIKERVMLDSEIKKEIGEIFPSIVRVVNDKTTNNKEDFYFYDVAKMLMNETYTGLLMTRRSGVQVYCLGSVDEEAHFQYYIETKNYTGLYEIENGIVIRKLSINKAKAFYRKIVEKHDGENREIN